MRMESLLGFRMAWHLLTVVVVIILKAGAFALTDQGQALLSLRSFLGDHNGHLNDWLISDLTPCSWNGISCDNVSNVISLNLSDMNLTGTLSSDICSLRSLVSISIQLNNFTGSLPQEMSYLSQLRFLNISHNNFSNVFPTNVSGLQLLETLDAYNNNFSASLPIELAKLKNLQHLHLGGNYFQGSIPPSYGGMQQLKFLGLSGNLLSGRIPAEIGNLSQLEYLYLGYYNTYEGRIPSELGRLHNLVRLDISDCGISGAIPASLGNLTHLDSLFLQINLLSGSLPAELGNLINLKSLDVSNNRLSGQLPLELQWLKKLELASFFRNQISGELPPFFADIPSLQVLFLWENSLTGYIPQQLGNMQSLILLDLSSNRLGGTIPPNLCSGGKLEELMLFDNELEGAIPHSLSFCYSLLRMRLGKNRLTGPIPEGLMALSNLQMLELLDNNLTGQLPGTFKAPQLDILDISANDLTGVVSEGISNLTMLSLLFLSGNRFSGSIPGSIGSLRKLINLDLSNNAFYGSIPEEISRCESLSSLDLSNNQFSGNIPPQLENLQELDFINLSKNHLTGSIPSELQLLPSLTVADFSYNNLSGPIPLHGQFGYFNASAFIGNPGLCSAQLRSCLEAAPGLPLDGHAKSKSRPQFLIWLVGGIFSAALLILVGGICCLFKSYQPCICWLFQRKNAIKPWKLTAFQKLDFNADHVLDCLTEENIIGRGGSGIVYRGVMPTGEIVAVKRLSSQGRKGMPNDNGFSAEIQTLGKIRHRNIVKLLGCCSNQETNLLLYEYMPKGSLGELLHSKQGSVLDWKTRYNIAVQAAIGLSYLHHDCSPLIVHRDVKSNNILLDSDFRAHVADFGLARFFQNSGKSQSMSSIAGSYGYIAPEYAYTLKVNEKSDIYSFGVVLLELVSGRRPIESEYGDGVDIVQWVRRKVRTKDGVTEVLDPRIPGDRIALQEVMLLLRVALLCSNNSPTERPTMRDTVQMLCGSKAKSEKSQSDEIF